MNGPKPNVADPWPGSTVTSTVRRFFKHVMNHDDDDDDIMNAYECGFLSNVQTTGRVATEPLMARKWISQQ